MTIPFMMNKIILNWKGDPLRLHYTSTLTDNNNVYGENAGKKVTDKKSHI
jgi:hypothetical protein